MFGITQNLYFQWKNIGNQPGWGIHEHNKLVLLKSPANVPDLNLCIGAQTEEDFTAAKKFFGNKSFAILEKASNPLPFELNTKVDVEIAEMHAPTPNSEPGNLPAEISIITDDASLQEFADLSFQIFEINSDAMYSFLKPLSKIKKSVIFMAKINGKPIGTGQIYVDNNGLGLISTLGVLEKFRRRGIGTKLMQASVTCCVQNGATSLALFASEMGKGLYSNLGFKEAAIWKFKVI